MAQPTYFGTYGRFISEGKAQGALLLGADTLVGDELVLRWNSLAESEAIYVDNRFGGAIGRLDAACAQHVRLLLAKDWQVHVLLASIYQQQTAQETRWWGEVVVLAYPASAAQNFDVFVKTISRMLARGVRPSVTLAESAVEQVVAHAGKWEPTSRVAPIKEEGSILIKDQLSLNEKLVEQARAGNIGCMICGWAFIGVLVLGLGYFVVRLLGL